MTSGYSQHGVESNVIECVDNENGSNLGEKGQLGKLPADHGFNAVDSH